LFYKTKNKKNNENATKNLNNDENELSKYRCMKCNLLIYPAKGREQKFLKDLFYSYFFVFFCIFFVFFFFFLQK
ncbi:hypothetical protein, partial [Plasmodium yoelii yoelii]